MFSLTASAGEVLLTTDSSVEVSRDGVTIGRATGPGQLSLGDFPPGPTSLQFKRDQSILLTSTIDVPKSGTLTLRLDGDLLHTKLGQQALLEPPSPVVVFRPHIDQQFSVIINQKESFLINNETQLDTLDVGTHHIEVRTPDKLTIWAKGALTLRPGDTVVLDIEIGRSVKAIGNENAWKNAGIPKTQER